jgi:epoxyqueuosine reductase
MLERLRAALAEEGLLIVRPLSQAALDRAGVTLSLAALLPGGRTGVVIGDGGPGFFERFSRHADPSPPDPLDAYTRGVVGAAFSRAIADPGAFALRFPFARESPPLPIQRLGAAAGLPPPGPLGLQIHPRFGPWWAYRAFAVVLFEAPDDPALESPCTGCPAPCVPACPGGAVGLAGFAVPRCVSHRLADEACRHSCAARLRCPVGADARYPGDQLRYHMQASWLHLRRPSG